MMGGDIDSAVSFIWETSEQSTTLPPRPPSNSLYGEDFMRESNIIEENDFEIPRNFEQTAQSKKSKKGKLRNMKVGNNFDEYASSETMTKSYSSDKFDEFGIRIPDQVKNERLLDRTPSKVI